MKTIGLIGGMSWESSLEYYRIINETVKERLGGLHSAKSIMYSVDFEDVEKIQHQGNWHEAAKLMIDAAQRLEKVGADFIIICTNTMHKVADEVQKSIQIPLFHIADMTAKEIRKQGLKVAGLLGTRFTMEQDFYKIELVKYDVKVIIPDEGQRQMIHDVIYRELCLGVIKQSSRDSFRKVIESLVSRGAEGIILGCTEIPMLVKQEDYEIPIFDTTRIHAVAAVEYAIS